jgi:hypothetical protein
MTPTDVTRVVVCAGGLGTRPPGVDLGVHLRQQDPHDATFCVGWCAIMAGLTRRGLSVMNDRSRVLSPESLPRPGEVALLTAIDAVLDVPAGELPGRVALVRRYIGAALDAVPGTRRVTFQVVAQMLARDAIRDSPADGDDHPPQ